MKPILRTIVLLFLAVASLRALPETYFTTEGVEDHLVTLIRQSQTSIDLAVFEFSSPVLAEALRRAHQRGVTVRLVLDARSGRKDSAGASLKDLNVREIAGRNGRTGLMHDKFAIFDGRRVVTGSYNWTRSAERSNYENVLIEDDPNVVNRYQHQFSLLWSRASQKHIENSDRFRPVLWRLSRPFRYRRFFWRRKL